jgi:hypothetical protein
VRLADVYQIIAHYLNNVTEIDDYLRRRRAEAVALQREAEARFDAAGIRGRLIARRHPASR